MYKDNYIFTFRDVDRNYNVNFHSLLQVLFTVATKHLDNMGFDPMYLEQKNLAWVVYESSIDMHKTNLYAHNIKIVSFVKNVKNVYSMRYFMIYDENGNFIGSATSKWVVIDTKKRSLAKIPEEIILAFEKDTQSLDENSKNLMHKKNEKIQRLDIVYKNTSFDIRYFDIDPNKHVNNIIYPAWAVESLYNEDGFLDKYNLVSANIIYKKECPYTKNKVNINYSLNDNVSIHEIYDDENNLLAIINLQFKKM